MVNSRKLDYLREDVRKNVETLLSICEKQGLKVTVTSTYRDEEYQRECYKNGTSATPLVGFHNKGLAFDICQNIVGYEYTDLNFFNNVAVIAKEMGFTWGGDWKTFPDRPHFQWDGNGLVTTAMLRKGVIVGTMPTYTEMKTYTTVDDLPKWAVSAVKKAISAGAIKGDESGNINLSEDLARMTVILDRLGILHD